ncbi:MAG: NAD(P)/FAD-dependent oxidoreductase, partial [Candidatus Aminicenantaceae bacterium]
QRHYIETQNQILFKRLNKELEKVHIHFLSNTVVWGIFEDKIIATDSKDHALIKAKKLLIAEGAYETPVAFPGWTMPGVMTLGGVQILLKSQGVIPQGKILIAGTGPLLYFTAAQLVKNGANVIGVLEASPLSQWMKWIFRLIRSPKLLMKGIQYLLILKKHRVPVYYSHVVVKAQGEEHLEKIIFAKADKHWKPLSRTEKTVNVDILGLNWGFIPSTIFSHMAGCQHECDPLMRWWIPKTNSNYETLKEGIFVAGDCTGIGGVKSAVLEGEIAGTEVSFQLGRISKLMADRHQARLKKSISHQKWYYEFLRKIYAFRPGLLHLLSDDTIICRCEEIDYKTITKIIEDGAHHIDQIKRLLRVGMGRCQGRFCYPTLLGLLANILPLNELHKEDFSARPPAKPIPLKILSKESPSGEENNKL